MVLVVGGEAVGVSVDDSLGTREGDIVADADPVISTSSLCETTSLAEGVCVSVCEAEGIREGDGVADIVGERVGSGVAVGVTDDV